MDPHDNSNPYSSENLQAPPPRKSRRRRLIVLTLLLAAGVGIGLGVWYALTPHSGPEQFAKAETLQQRLLTEGPNLEPQRRQELLNKTLEAYRKVLEFDPDAPEAVRAHLRLAELYEQEGDPEAARVWLRKLIEQGRTDDATREAYARLADSLETAAREAEAAGADAAARAAFDQAAEALADFGARFGPDAPAADELALRRCRILHEHLAPPWDRPIAALTDFTEQFPDSDLLDEALLRLGRIHERIGEHERAGRYYQRLIDEFPDSEHLLEAEKGRARALTETDPEAGEQAWRDLAEKYKDDPDVLREAQAEAERLADQRQRRQQQDRQQQAREQAEQYEQQRYGGGGVGGGGGGFADRFGKPVPPQEMLRDFIDQRIDAEHYRISLTLEPDGHRIVSTGEIDLVNRGDEKTDFLLMLGAVLTPGDFTLDGAPVEVRRVPGKPDVVQLRLDAPWPAGASATLAYEFEGVAPPLPELPESMKQQILEQFSRTGRGGAILAQATAPATAPAEDEQAPTAPEPPPEATSPADYLRNPSLQMQINDTGYALSGAAWYPVTIFGDVFTAEIDAELRGQQQFVSSGLMLENELTDGVRRTRWVCRKPYFGLYWAYGPYQVLRRELDDGLTLRGYFLEAQTDLAEGYLDTTEQVLELYAQRFGPFAFEKMSVIQVDLPPILGGVGPAGMVFLHSYVISNHERVLSNLLAHELGHQWWGNKVPINMLDDDWNQWLSEGFATYSDALYTEHSEGPEAFAEHIDKLADLYLQQTRRMREDPISQTFMDQSPLYRPVVYEKGALVLHALRYVLGDEAFFEVLRAYADRCAFTESTVGDFRRLASEAAGENLDWFFSEWLDRPGCPEFEIASVTVGEPDDRRRRAVVVEIVQPGALSRMPMDVRAIGPEGRSETVRAELGRKENTVTIETDFEVEAVVLDPDNWVLQRSGPDQRRWDAGD